MLSANYLHTNYMYKQDLVSVRVPFKSEIDLLKNYLYSIGSYAKKCKYECTMIVISLPLGIK